VVRTRFAPSPTGSLHVGNARIAVLNWLFTRRHGGEFVLRLEDTDRARNVAAAEARIAADLEWLGVPWDEGPAIGAFTERGAHGPYRQTERLATYRTAAERLRAGGFTYDCYCEAQTAQGDGESAQGESADDEPREAARCACAALTSEEIARYRDEGREPALRFRVPAGRQLTVHDAVFGDVDFESDSIADFIILRADGVPTYNFAVVLDDVTMAITHVIRGSGHLSNTPRQLLVYEALGEDPPLFAHIPMVLGPDRQKLSKRHGARALADYESEGYHPDALVNYLSLLSWSSPSGEEVLDREQLVREISLERIGVADVVFDPVKLRWLSAQHIARMPLDGLVTAVRPFVDAALPIPEDGLPVAIAAIRTHLATFSDVDEQLAAFFPQHDAATPAADSAGVLGAARRRLQNAEWTEEALTAAVRAAGKDAHVSGRALYEPLRLALTGRAHGPPLAAVLLVQGRASALRALELATSADRAPEGEGN
jgi:nondiscriminating glutamyl-tRNA synthetase